MNEYIDTFEVVDIILMCNSKVNDIFEEPNVFGSESFHVKTSPKDK